MKTNLIIIFCLQIRLIITQHNQCDFTIYDSAIIGESYKCRIKLLSGSIQEQENHLADKSNLDVTTVEIDYVQLDQIPLQIGETFINLESLHISGGTIKSLSMENFQNMPNLRVLSIQNNTGIQVLQSNLFEYTQKLEKIILRNNSLNFISRKTFIGLTNLTLVQLERNQCVDMVFKDDAIANLSSYLMKQCYGRNEMFCEKNSEESCSCAMRQYEYIETMDMSQILVLGDCENANIKELLIKSVCKIYIADNRFPSFFLKALKQLEIFTMSNGKLKVLESAHLESAEMLKKLDLSDNMIKELRSDVFENAPKLEIIDLTNNQIEAIGIATFSHLNYLQYVILKGNGLSSQDIFTASEIKQLESEQIPESCKVHDVLFCKFSDVIFGYTGRIYTCLAKNVKQQFKYHDFKNGESFYGMVGKHYVGKTAFDIEAIAIQDQICNSLPTFLKPFFTKLRSLSIVKASLQTLTKNNFENLGMLQRLDVSNNEIQHLDFKVFEATPKLRFIDFSNNRILTADFKDFNNLKVLQAVNFLDNLCLNVKGIISNEYDMEAIKSSLDICSSIVLSCEYNDPNICKVTSIFDKKVQLWVRDVTVDNDSYPVENFTSLIIENVTFTVLPNKLSEFMPNLETIIVTNTSLEAIGTEVLGKFKNLKTLKITKNKLSILSPEMFEDNLNLKHMDFSQNNFIVINSKTFVNLKQLKFLNLNSPGCFDFITEKGHLLFLSQRNVQIRCEAWSADNDYIRPLSGESEIVQPPKIYTPVY